MANSIQRIAIGFVLSGLHWNEHHIGANVDAIVLYRSKFLSLYRMLFPVQPKTGLFEFEKEMKRRMKLGS